MEELKKVSIIPLPVVKARGIINPAKSSDTKKSKNVPGPGAKVTNTSRCKQQRASSQDNSSLPKPKQSTDNKSSTSTPSSLRLRFKSSSCALQLKEVKAVKCKSKSPTKPSKSEAISDNKKRSPPPKKRGQSLVKTSATETRSLLPLPTKSLDKFKIPKRSTAQPETVIPSRYGKQENSSQRKDLPLDKPKRATNEEDTKRYHDLGNETRKRLSFDGKCDERKPKKSFQHNSSSHKISNIEKPDYFKDKRHSAPVAAAVVFPTDESTHRNQNIPGEGASIADNHIQQNVGQEAEEAMDFDNPLPEIFQLLTESHKKVNDREDAMDIDLILPTYVNNGKQLLVIPDTNVWIDNRATLELLLETEFCANCSTSIIIPWMVLQEIDHNIHRRTQPSLFRSAAKFIHHLLSSKNTRVRGEKASEALISMEFSPLNADDSILNCAIQYNKLIQFKTVFLTNDINLLNKALVHDINAFKPDSSLSANIRKLFEETGVASPFISPPSPHIYANNQNRDMFQQFPSIDRPSEEFSSCSVMEIDEPVEEFVPNSNSTPDPVTFDTVVIALKQTLTNIIVLKMVEEYGADGWRFAIKIQPPFTVESALKCMQVHWIAVFSFMFPRQGKDTIDELVAVFRQKPDVDELNSWRHVICQLAFKLLSINKELMSKRPRVAECCLLLQSYIEGSSAQTGM